MNEERRNALIAGIKAGSIDKNSESDMADIQGDKELSELYRQYEKLSSALRIALADPPKDKEGRTLSEILAERVRKGDVLPRYADVSKHHFPFATAACLAVACVVLIIAGKNGILGRNKTADGAANMTLQDSYADEEMSLYMNGTDSEMAAQIKDKETYFYAGGVGASAPKEEEAEAFLDVPETAQLDSGVENAGEGSDEAVEDRAEKPLMMMTAPHRSEGSEEAQKQEPTVTAEEETADVNNAFANGFSGSIAGDPEDADANRSESKAEKKKPGSRPANGAVTDEKSDAAINGAENGSAVPEDILARLEQAKLLFEEAGLEMPDDSQIVYDDILRYGEDNFRAYFDSIRGEQDFVSLYGLSAFAAFCDAAKETE